MVVIGHSQGGLLTKLTTVDSGMKFWTTDMPFDEVKASPETKETLRRSVFLSPFPR